jgi:hypothetical protein
MSNCWRDGVKGRPAIQKREAWDTTPQDGKDFINAVIEVFGKKDGKPSIGSRIMMVTQKGFYDTGRYYDNKDKRGRQKSG